MGTAVSGAKAAVMRLRLCPFSSWALLYVGGIFLGNVLLSKLAAVTADWIAAPPLVVGLATLISLVAVERSYAQGQDCDWLPDERNKRAAIYALSFVVGLFVILPGVSLDRGVPAPFRVITSVSLTALVALLVLHLRSHQETEEQAARGGYFVLRWLSVLPALLLGLIVAAIVVIGVIEVWVHPP